MTDKTQTTERMSLDHALEELEQQVMHFGNEMRRSGITSASPECWVDLFRGWQLNNPLSVQYADTLKWMASHA